MTWLWPRCSVSIWTVRAALRGVKEGNCQHAIPHFVSVTSTLQWNVIKTNWSCSFLKVINKCCTDFSEKLFLERFLHFYWFTYLLAHTAEAQRRRTSGWILRSFKKRAEEHSVNETEKNERMRKWKIKCLWGVFKLFPFGKKKKKSLRHLSSHKSLARELKKSKEITNTKRHAALNVCRLPPTLQEFKRIITLSSLITTQRSVRAARNIVFLLLLLFN